MNKIKIWHVHILGIIVIAVLCCINIRVSDCIYVINDEFGYWTHAVSAVGYDWKDLISETPYYSWGYSLWLIPVIMLLPTPELWYKAAVFLNVLFLITSYCLCYKSGIKLFREVDKKLIAIAACLVVIYPSNIDYAQVTWTETLSYLLVWIVTYLIICLDEKYSNMIFFSTLLVLIYAYAVHNKNIGIVLAGIIALCAVLIKHKKKLGYFLVMFLILGIGYKGIDLVKAHQIQTLWSSSKASNMNNVSVNTATITAYSNKVFKQISLFLQSLFGKYIYLLIGTGMTLPIAVINFLRDTVKNIKGKEFWKSYEISKIWIVLAASFMYGICAIQMMEWKWRADYIVYGRYMENALGPILFLSIMFCILQIRETRIGLVIAAVSLLFGIMPVYYWITNANEVFNVICSPVIGAFYQYIMGSNRGNNMGDAFKLIGILLVLSFGILFGITFCKRRRVAAKLIVIYFALTYTVLGYYGAMSVAKNREVVDNVTVPLREKISGELKENEIFYIKNDELDYTSRYPKFFQFLIPDRTIHVVTQEEIDTLPNENIIVMMNPDDLDVIEYFEQNMDAEEVDYSWMLKVYAVDGNMN